MNKIRELFKDHKFAINFIIGVLGFIGLDRFISWATKTIHVIPWINNLMNNYIGLIFIILLFIMLFSARKQSLIHKKLSKISLETYIIRSDKKTIFIGSETNRALPTNVEAVPIMTYAGWKQEDPQYPELSKALWIADRKIITDQEAIEGGQYTFAREFTIPFEINQLRTAEIQILVDDFCELIVNGTRYDKFEGSREGKQSITIFDITKLIREGNNRIQFLIENISFNSRNDPTVDGIFANSKEKYRLNPYGFKYCIIMEYWG